MILLIATGAILIGSSLRSNGDYKLAIAKPNRFYFGLVISLIAFIAYGVKLFSN